MNEYIVVLCCLGNFNSSLDFYIILWEGLVSMILIEIFLRVINNFVCNTQCTITSACAALTVLFK